MCTTNELLTSFHIKMFNHQTVGTDTNKYRLLISPNGVSCNNETPLSETSGRYLFVKPNRQILAPLIKFKRLKFYATLSSYVVIACKLPL